MTSKTVQLPANLYLSAGQDSTPGIYNWVNTHTQAGDTVVWPTGTVELRSMLWSLGRTFQTANVFDLSASPKVVRPVSTNEPIFAGRSEHETTNTAVYHGARFVGFTVFGSNSGWQKFSGTNYGEDAFSISGQYSELCQVVLCEGSNLWGDFHYGGGTTLACHGFRLGRHGRTMHFTGAAVKQSKLEGMHGRAYALETGHTAYGVEISNNTLSGNAGYVACAVTPGTSDYGTKFSFGMKFVGNHSTQADGLPLVDWAWGGQWVCSMDGDPISSQVFIENNTFVEVALDGNKSILNTLDPHYAEGMQTPGFTVNNVNGLTVTGNQHLCRGPFLATVGCTNVTSSGNVGGAHMTSQM